MFFDQTILTNYFSQMIYLPLRYFSEQILVALLKTFIIILEGIDGLICMFVIADLR